MKCSIDSRNRKHDRRFVRLGLLDTSWMPAMKLLSLLSVLMLATLVAGSANLSAQSNAGYPLVAVSGGYFFSLGVASDGTLWAWGYNANGQLGTGNKINSPVPIQVGTSTNWVSVSAGWVHSFGIKSDGSLWGWGYNGYGQIGDGTIRIDRTSPVRIGTDNNWSTVSGGYYHSLGLKSDGTLWAWGSNRYGQLGNGNNVDQSSPVQIGIGSIWVAICAGANHSLALRSDGTLWAWGLNSGDPNYGQLGDGTAIDKNYPVQVGNENTWRKISAGFVHSAGIKSDGTLWIWGGAHQGELGLGDWVSRTSPVQTGTDNDWAAVSAKNDTTHALKSDGALWGWGDNTFGQLGDGTTTKHLTPYRIGADRWTRLERAYYHAFGFKLDGTLWGWGRNDYGQLGDGTTLTNSLPVPVGPVVPKAFQFDPASLTFADQKEGTSSAPRTVTLTNISSGVITIGVVGFGGTYPGDFHKAGDGCSGAVLPPLAVCSVSVAFLPTAPGVRSATLTVPSNAPGSPHSIALSGNGVSATLPVVAVLSPNGGEKLYSNSSYRIDWSASSAVGLTSFDVLYSADDGLTYTAVPGCTAVSATSTSCLWAAPVPATALGRIRVIARDIYGQTASDASDAKFAIIAGSASIAITSPNTAVTWAIGTTQQIRWNHNLGAGAYVAVDISRDGGTIWTPLASSFRNTADTSSTFDWVVTAPATTKGRVRVTWINGPATDVSDLDFSVIAAEPGGPVGYWKFNEASGTVANDSSGNGLNGVLAGTTPPQWTIGQNGPALAFDGLTSAVAVPHHTLLNPSQISIALWIKTTTNAPNNNGSILQKGGTAGYRIRCSASAVPCRPQFLFNNLIGAAGSPLPLNEWHHLTVTGDSSGNRVFFDGVLSGSATQPYVGATSTAPLIVGDASNPAMLLYDVRVYGRALSATEVAALYDSGKVPALPDKTLPNVSLTAPLNGSTVGGSVTLSASASDPVVSGEVSSGIASVRFLVDGSLVAEDTSSPYSVSWNSTSTTGGSHLITAIATDLAGNSRTSSSVSIVINNTIDLTAPVVSGGSPAGTLPAQTTSTTISVSTNEVAICKYGTVAGVSFASLPNTFNTTAGTLHSAQISGLTAGATYTWYVRCIDQAGNANTSDYTISFSVSAGTTAGPVGYWKFNEGSGTVANDSSGNGLNGVLAGTTLPQWTIGQNGPALAFDGLTSGVAVPHHPLLNPSQISIALWIKTTTNAPNNNGSLLQKGGTAGYRIRCSASAAPCRPQFLFNNVIGAAGSPLPLNEWHHLTVTADSAGNRVFVDGVLSGSTTQPYVGATSTASLIAGGGSNPAMVLYDVRVYGRALSAAEVTALYESGKVPVLPDKTLPNISVTAPQDGATVGGSVTLSATAVDPVVSGEITSGIASVKFLVDGAVVGEDTSSPYSVSWNSTSTAGGSHLITAVATDLAGNSRTSSSVSIVVDNTTDRTPPVVSDGSPSGSLPSQTTATTISVSTNEIASCRYGPVAGVSFALLPNSFSTTTGTLHSSQISGLTAGGTYTWYVRCMDQAGNANASDYTISFSVGATSSGLEAGLILHLTFDNNGYSDSSPVQNTVAWAAPSFVPGVRSASNPADTAASPSQAWLEVKPNPALSGMAALTYSVWVKKNVPTAQEWMLEQSGPYYLQVTSQGYVKAGVFSVDPTQTSQYYTDIISYYQGNNTLWNLYTVVFNGTSYTLYINGARIATKVCVASNCLGSVLYSPTNPIIIGGRRPNQYFDGVIDDLRIYNRALSDAEVGQLYSGS